MIAGSMELALRNTLIQMVEPGATKTDRLKHMKFNTATRIVHLVCPYAPTLISSSDAKDASTVSLKIPSKDSQRKTYSSLETSMPEYGMTRAHGSSALGMQESARAMRMVSCFFISERTFAFVLPTLSLPSKNNIVCHRYIQALAPAGSYHHLTKTSLHHCSTHTYHSADCDSDHSPI